jgi:hypothetical protein
MNAFSAYTMFITCLTHLTLLDLIIILFVCGLVSNAVSSPGFSVESYD